MTKARDLSQNYSNSQVDGIASSIDDSAVKIDGDQQIGGIKTFSSSPIVPNATTPTAPMAYGQILGTV
jgi:hypothetical protein